MGSLAPPQQNGNHSQPRRVYLLTSPRTASNLFVRMLNAPEQPKVRQGKFYGGYFFMPAFMHRDKLESWHVPVNELPEKDKKDLGVEYQNGANLLKEHMDDCEQDDKVCFVKEHFNLLQRPTYLNETIFGTPSASVPDPWRITIDESTDTFTDDNPTVIPDNVLASFSPNFLIRHPAVQFPSLYRAHHDAWEHRPGPSADAQANILYDMRGIRKLYEFLAPRFQKADSKSPFPVVFDAADFILHPATVMKYFCDLNGFELAHCKFNWDVVSDEMMDKMKMTDVNKRMISTLNASTGIDKAKAMKDVNIDEEAVKWREEFGEEHGRHMEKCVRAAMPDYEFLYSKRWDPLAHSEEDIGTDIVEDVKSEVRVDA